MTRHWQGQKGRSLWVIFGAVLILAPIIDFGAAAAHITCQPRSRGRSGFVSARPSAKITA
jgi:hypothetical protein